jgi:hypothetical protein
MPRASTPTAGHQGRIDFCADSRYHPRSMNNFRTLSCPEVMAPSKKTIQPDNQRGFYRPFFCKEKKHEQEKKDRKQGGFL